MNRKICLVLATFFAITGAICWHGPSQAAEKCTPSQLTKLTASGFSDAEIASFCHVTSDDLSHIAATKITGDFVDEFLKIFVPITFSVPGSQNREITIPDFRYCGADDGNTANVLAVAYIGKPSATFKWPHFNQESRLISNADCAKGFGKTYLELTDNGQFRLWTGVDLRDTFLIRLAIIWTNDRFDFLVKDLNFPSAPASNLSKEDQEALKAALTNGGVAIKTAPIASIPVTAGPDTISLRLVPYFLNDSIITTISILNGGTQPNLRIVSDSDEIFKATSESNTSIVISYIIANEFLSKYLASAPMKLDIPGVPLKNLTLSELILVPDNNALSVNGTILDEDRHNFSAKLSLDFDELAVKQVAVKYNPRTCSDTSVSEALKCAAENIAFSQLSVVLGTALSGITKAKVLRTVVGKPMLPIAIDGRTAIISGSLQRSFADKDRISLDAKLQVYMQ